jgi:O-antigen biosynthesis protein
MATVAVAYYLAMDSNANLDKTTRYAASNRYESGEPNPNEVDSVVLSVSAVPPGSRVLDVGCHDGIAARMLKRRGCFVVGIDIDDAALQVAAQHCDAVLEIDLDRDIATELKLLMESDAVKGVKFDVIVLMDVLEHLRNPLEVLTELVSTCLAPHGRCVMSIPNVAHGSVRLALLSGRFDYEDWGLLDRTHLRFFTRNSVGNLLAEAGLIPIVQTAVRKDVEFGAETGSQIQQLIVADKDSSVYQFIVVAGRNDAPDVCRLDISQFVEQSDDLAVYEAERESAASEIQGLRARIEALLGDIEKVEQHQMELVAQVGQLDEELLLRDRLRDQVIADKVLFQAAQVEIGRLKSALADRNERLERARQVEERLRAVESSQSWKIGYVATHPIRLVKRFQEAVKATRS